MNFVSLFFLLIFLHFFKGLFFKSFNLKEVWNIGLIILLFLIIESFLGYVLIWSQMSFWACTVITSLVIVIPFLGVKLVFWIWRNFFISSLTLKLFFLFHFILPLLILILIVFHLFFLHFYLRTRKSNFYIKIEKIIFFPFYWLKDIYNLIIIFLFFIWIFFLPLYFNDCEIFLESNYLSSPIHIVPEWYFLFAYDILRSIKNKLFGVFILIIRIIIFFIFNLKKKTFNFKLNNIFNYIFFFNLIFIRWLGACLVELPFIVIRIIFSIFYFFILFFIFYF